MKKILFAICAILLTQGIFCEDILEKIKQTIKENSQELLKEMNEEIAKLKKAEDFSISKMIELGIMKTLKNHDIYKKEKKIIKKIEKEYEVLKTNPNLQKAEEFLVNLLKNFKGKIQDSDTLIKEIKQILAVVKSLASVAIPKPLPLPNINKPAKYPREGDDEKRRKELENRSKYPKPPAPAPYKPNDERRWERNGESRECNADNCKSCCIRRQCFPIDECRYLIISRTIVIAIVLICFCFGCCGLAIGAICYFNKKRRDLELIASKRQLKENEMTSVNQAPVQGIPVQQSTQGTVVAVQPEQTVQKPGFRHLAEESTSEAQMQDLP